MPGPLIDLCGVQVEDFTLIVPRTTSPRIAWSDGIQAPVTTADGFNDVLTINSPDAVVLARYDAGYYAGAPVLVRTPSGAGSAYYYGAAFNQSVAETLIDLCGPRSPADGLLTLPDEVELAIRTPATGSGSLWFLLNFAPTSQQITVHGQCQDLLTGDAVSGGVVMEPFAVLLLMMQGDQDLC
jgi:beta-galactosidase